MSMGAEYEGEGSEQCSILVPAAHCKVSEDKTQVSEDYGDIKNITLQ